MLNHAFYRHNSCSLGMLTDYANFIIGVVHQCLNFQNESCQSSSLLPAGRSFEAPYACSHGPMVLSGQGKKLFITLQTVVNSCISQLNFCSNIWFKLLFIPQQPFSLSSRQPLWAKYNVHNFNRAIKSYLYLLIDLICETRYLAFHD